MASKMLNSVVKYLAYLLVLLKIGKNIKKYHQTTLRIFMDNSKITVRLRSDFLYLPHQKKTEN